MPDWLHRTDIDLLVSIPESELPQAAANYIEDPDLSSVTGQPRRYWKISGDIVSLATAPEQAAIDAAIVESQRDAKADELDELEATLRAFALVVLDEVNVVRSRAFGGLYRDAAVTVQSIPNNTFTKLNALTGATAMEVGGGVVADVINGEITLPSVGTWRIGYSLSFSGSNNTDYEFAVFSNGSKLGATTAVRALGSGGGTDIGSVSGSGFVQIASPNAAIDLRVGQAESGARDITVERMQLWAFDFSDRADRTISQLKTAVRNKLGS